MVDISAVLDVVSIFFAGLLSGEEFIIFYGLRTPLATLDAIPQLQLRQALIHRLKIMVPAIFVPALLFGIASTIALTTGLVFLFHCVGLFGLFAWAIVTLPGTARINSAIAEWNPNAPPADWKETVRAWERYASVRPWGAIIAFVMFLIAVVH